MYIHAYMHANGQQTNKQITFCLNTVVDGAGDSKIKFVLS